MRNDSVCIASPQRRYFAHFTPKMSRYQSFAPLHLPLETRAMLMVVLTPREADKELIPGAPVEPDPSMSFTLTLPVDLHSGTVLETTKMWASDGLIVALSCASPVHLRCTRGRDAIIHSIEIGANYVVCSSKNRWP